MENKHFEIMLHNGNHPFSYECSNIAEAYGCFEDMQLISPRLAESIDMCDIMRLLVNMENGVTVSRETRFWSIFVRDGEV